MVVALILAYLGAHEERRADGRPREVHRVAKDLFFRVLRDNLQLHHICTSRYMNRARRRDVATPTRQSRDKRFSAQAPCQIGEHVTDFKCVAPLMFYFLISTFCNLTLAMPKSPSFTILERVRNIFCVLRSRCSIFLSWMCFSASVICTNLPRQQ